MAVERARRAERVAEVRPACDVARVARGVGGVACIWRWLGRGLVGKFCMTGRRSA